MSDWSVHRRVESVCGAAAVASDEWLLTVRDGPGESGIRGSLRVRFDVGQSEPRYWYHLGTLIHSAPEIGVLQRQRTLTLCSDLCGGTELFDCQGDARAAQLLVQAALLWLSRAAPSTPRVFAELPGVRTSHDKAAHSGGIGVEQSEFFDTVMRHFLPASPLGGPGEGRLWPADVAGLLPRHPLYVAMLPSHVQAQIGHAADDVQHWQRALAGEGLAAARMVSVVDAGPVHEGALDTSRIARDAAWREVVPHGAPTSDEPEAGRCAFVAMLVEEDNDTLHRATGRFWNDLLKLEDPAMEARFASGTKVWCAPIE